MMIARARHLTIGVALVLAAGGALSLRPAPGASAVKMELETLIPKQFSDWTLEVGAASVVVDPELAAAISTLYKQTLTRTYVNRQGQKIMLSIVYGNQQNRDFQVHRPEVCYTAQGFIIHDMLKDTLETAGGGIPVMRMVARQGARSEPVIYWVRIGNDVVRGNVEQAVARMRYGLAGTVPDGLLFRISTITANAAKGYAAEQAFVDALMHAVPREGRVSLVGSRLAS